MGKTFGVGEPWLNSCLEFRKQARNANKNLPGGLGRFLRNEN